MKIDDLISRTWLQTAIHNFYQGLKHTPTEEDIQAYIDAAPSATQRPEKGHWIIGKYKDTCSRCRCTYPKNIGIKNFCSYCGSFNGSESEDKNEKKVL